MPYEDVGPRDARLVHVEWLDITGDSGSIGLARRWTVGHLLSTTHISEGVECTVTGITWDEDGWSEFSTYPNSVIVSLEGAQ